LNPDFLAPTRGARRGANREVGLASAPSTAPASTAFSVFVIASDSEAIEA